MGLLSKLLRRHRLPAVQEPDPVVSAALYVSDGWAIAADQAGDKTQRALAGRINAALCDMRERDLLDLRPQLQVLIDLVPDPGEWPQLPQLPPAEALPRLQEVATALDPHHRAG